MAVFIVVWVDVSEKPHTRDTTFLRCYKIDWCCGANDIITDKNNSLLFFVGETQTNLVRSPICRGKSKTGEYSIPVPYYPYKNINTKVVK